LVDNFYFKRHKKYYSVDHKYNAEKKDKQKEIDVILDKIGRTGMDSLTRKEKETLEEYSRSVR
ncbi:MAG: rhomboid family intramembrane serine protease, partial [Chitinophagaceae bacterium]|nr:rhomboid family intramembrane serine protease [Chitinophagaceae bacterium]